MPSGQHQSPARDDPLLGIDQDRKNEAEAIEARLELVHLPRRMLAGFTPQGLAACNQDKLGTQITRQNVTIPAMRDQRIHLPPPLVTTRRPGPLRASG